jgi:Domain of unknown function (DUF4418)
MKKTLGGLIIFLALVIAIVPLLTNCLSQALTMTSTTSLVDEMKYHWSAIAEMILAVPLGLVGILQITSRVKETERSLGLISVVIGALVILVPTLLIGGNDDPILLSNLVMKLLMIISGSLAGAAGLFILYASRSPEEQPA